MSVGFVMLVHTAFDRAEQVARHFAARDCPVVIHVDKRVPAKQFSAFRDALSAIENIQFCRRVRIDWGTWSLVEATQHGAELMLERFPKVRHVYLSSGSCMPLRPVEELKSYLADRPRTDFIESVTTAEVTWTVDGLSKERFAYRFPFAWRKNRWIFDKYFRLQRSLGLKRKVPDGLTPHLGSQWWCLTRQTLSAILSDPERAKLDRWFKKVWIPDEAYFQTLVRKYSTDVQSRSLTLSKFDHLGKPHIFYDDHLQLLRRSDCFMARKIWHRANALYDAFLVPPGETPNLAEPNPAKIDRVFSRAMERRKRGRPGLYMQSRFPMWDWENGKTAARYNVFCGFSELFADFETWLDKRIGGRVHGHLFHPDGVEFAGRTDVFNGCLSDNATLRDYRADQFLTNLIWITRGETQSFMYGPGDTQKKVLDLMAYDINARIALISGAWAVPLYLSNRNFEDIRSEAARLQATEEKMLKTLRSVHVRAQIKIWTLADFIEAPMENLQDILDDLAGPASRRLTEAPVMQDLSGFGQFLQNLRNQGMLPTVMGDFPVTPTPAPQPDGAKPYVVK